MSDDSTIIPFPTSRPQRLAGLSQCARRLLEQYRQTRLKDCPYKEPVAVPLRVWEDSRLPAATRWEEIAQLGLTF